MNQGTLIISLDFELHWGGFEKWPLAEYKKYFANTRMAIPEMLDLFNRFNVHVTWATVGMLFHSTREEMVRNFPTVKPTYDDSELSAYKYIERHGIGVDETSDQLHFADSLIKTILKTPHQELASHTFAHYYCNEAGQTLEQFREDLKAAQRAASKYDVTLKSLVFPRNQFNEHYLRICRELGFNAVRGNPRDWFWDIQSTRGESFWKRLNRGLDAYFPIGFKNTYKMGTLSNANDLPVCIPASRLLRPYNPNELFLNPMKISRICGEMERAAKYGEAYHLWWHPHNFGKYPMESMMALKQILQFFSRLNGTFDMRSLNMGEVALEVMNSGTSA